MRNAKAAGIYIGAYHYAHPDRNSAIAEADHFVSVIMPYISTGYMVPALDLEEGYSIGKPALSQWVNTFMNRVKARTGVTPVIYTSANYARNYLDSSVTVWPLWIAHWTYNPGSSPSTGVWSTWYFWQYSDKGHVPGISGNVDLDVFNGDLSALEASFVIH